MDIIAFFCDIDHFYFYLKDEEIIAYSKGGNSVGWDLHVRGPKKGRCGLKPRQILNKNLFLDLRECHSCTIGVNLAVFDGVLATVDINMLKKHPSKNPLQGLGFCSKTLL